MGAKSVAPTSAAHRSRAVNRNFKQVVSRTWGISSKIATGDETWLTCMILNARHNQNNGYQEVEMVQSKQKQTAKSKGHGDSFRGCSRHFACWFSEVPKDNNVHLLWEGLEKVSQSFSRKRPGKASPESFSTTTVFLLIPLIKPGQFPKRFNGKSLVFTLQFWFNAFWLLFAS